MVNDSNMVDCEYTGRLVNVVLGICTPSFDFDLAVWFFTKFTVWRVYKSVTYKQGVIVFN